MKVEFTGLDDLLKAFKKKLEVEIGAREVVRKHTGSLQGKAQRYAPVDTGFLKREIDADIIDNGLTGVVSSNAPYAVFQEFGTRYQAGTPHIGPAFRDVEPEFKADLKKVLK